jgi:serine/threonine protein kinase
MAPAKKEAASSEKSFRLRCVRGAFTVIRVDYKLPKEGNQPPSSSAFSLKYVHTNRLDNEESLEEAAEKLVMEAHYLLQLDHPNIIDFNAVSSRDQNDSYGEMTALGFFLETLENRIQKWRQESIGGFKKKWFWPSDALTRQTRQMIFKRMESVAVGVAKGMAYLHEKGILLPCLNPENIVFDEMGIVKLVGFGPGNGSNEFAPVESLAYMAPERMIGHISGRSEQQEQHSDVYAFGILLWYICTLEQPFTFRRNLTRAHFVKRVVGNHWRPSLGSITCRATRRIIQDCWDPKPKTRPSFVRIWLSLLDSINDAQLEESHPVFHPGGRRKTPNIRKKASPSATNVSSYRGTIPNEETKSVLAVASEAIVTSPTTSHSKSLNTSPNEFDAGTKETREETGKSLNTSPKSDKVLFDFGKKEEPCEENSSTVSSLSSHSLDQKEEIPSTVRRVARISMTGEII